MESESWIGVLCLCVQVFLRSVVELGFVFFPEFVDGRVSGICDMSEELCTVLEAFQHWVAGASILKEQMSRVERNATRQWFWCVLLSH